MLSNVDIVFTFIPLVSERPTGESSENWTTNTREDDWSVTVDPSVLSRPAHAQVRFLTLSNCTGTLSNCAGWFYWPTFWLCARPTSFKMGQQVYSLVEQLTNGLTVNNQAVTYSLKCMCAFPWTFWRLHYLRHHLEHITIKSTLKDVHLHDWMSLSKKYVGCAVHPLHSTGLC